MAEWKFAVVTDEFSDQGPNNATAEHFKSQNIFSALVRESIQNSLDVQVDESEPVVVRYSFGTLQGELSESLRKVEEHVRASHKEYPESSSYCQMIEFLDEHSEDSLTYLKVSDYNTTGMDYEEGNNKCGFHSFVKSIGNSSKGTEGTGGSYGFGKAAYYEISNSRSVLVSTKTTDGKTAFQGCSMLCTHRSDDKLTKYYHMGFYGNAGGKAVVELNDIPVELRRDVPGSDIYLLHVDCDEHKRKYYEESIVKETLRSFWMAIYRNKLKVVVDWEDDGVDDLEISRETLEQQMEQYYPDWIDASDGYGSPRAYYEAVHKAEPFNPESEELQECVSFEKEDLEWVGHICFYMTRNTGAKDSYIRMRKPLMVIDRKIKYGQRGFSGVVICDGYANDVLSKAEPPAHDLWDLGRVEPFRDRTDSKEYKALKAIPAIDAFVNKCIKEYFSCQKAKELEIEGLENYLYSTEENNPTRGNQEQSVGEPDGKHSDVETGEHISQPNGPVIKTIEPSDTIGTVTFSEPRETTGDKKDGGNSHSGKGKNDKKGGVHTGGQKVKKVESGEGENEVTKLFQVLKDVKVRCFAKKDANSNLRYTALLSPVENEDILNATIFITTSGEDTDENIPLVEAGQYEVSGNSIRGVNLVAGKATPVEFRFEDNIKHRISLVVYVTE